jgi:hypothetical protein
MSFGLLLSFGAWRLLSEPETWTAILLGGLLAWLSASAIFLGLWMLVNWRCDAND